MRFNRKAVAVGVLAAMLCTLALGVWNAFASPAMAVKQVKWNDTLGNSVANLPADTTFMTDESDTTRTVPISTDDWDWGAITASGSGLAAGGIAARVYFVATALNNGATDSLYFSVEQGTGRDSVYTYNPTGVVNFGTNVVAAIGLGTNGTSATGTNGIWCGTIKADPDSPGNTDNVWLCPSFRLRVFGDVGGSSPKLSGLKCYIVYPKRSESQ